MLAEVLRGGEATGHDDESGDASVVSRHDHVFVFGDLNYRLDAAALLASAAAPPEPSAATSEAEDAAAPLLAADASPRAALRDAAASAAAAVGIVAAEATAAAAETRDAAWRTAVAAVTAHRLEALAASDELKRSVAAGDVLPGFSEGDIGAFAPTFKLEAAKEGAKAAQRRAEQPGRAYSAKRVPAWTDRCVVGVRSSMQRGLTRALQRAVAVGKGSAGAGAARLRLLPRRYHVRPRAGVRHLHARGAAGAGLSAAACVVHKTLTCACVDSRLIVRSPPASWQPAHCATSACGTAPRSPLSCPSWPPGQRPPPRAPPPSAQP